MPKRACTANYECEAPQNSSGGGDGPASARLLGANPEDLQAVCIPEVVVPNYTDVRRTRRGKTRELHRSADWGDQDWRIEAMEEALSA